VERLDNSSTDHIPKGVPSQKCVSPN